MKKGLRYVLNVVLSLLLIALIIHFTGIDKIAITIAAMSISLFLVAVIIENVGVLVSAKKWHMLLAMKGVQIPFITAWKYYYIGTFFNAFFPTTVGGDVIKAYGLSQHLSKKEEAFSSAIMDRITGLAAVLIIGSVALIIGWQVIPQVALVLALIILLLPLALIILIFTTDAVGWLLRWSLFTKFGRLTAFAEQIYLSLREYRLSGRLLLPVVVLSLVYHGILVVNNYVLSQALGLDIPIYYFFIFIPIAEILVFLPVTIQGFGVREGTYVTLFSSIGVGAAQAFSLGFSNQLVKLIGNIIGGVVYAFSGRRDKSIIK